MSCTRLVSVGFQIGVIGLVVLLSAGLASICEADIYRIDLVNAPVRCYWCDESPSGHTGQWVRDTCTQVTRNILNQAMVTTDGNLGGTITNGSLVLVPQGSAGTAILSTAVARQGSGVTFELPSIAGSSSEGVTTHFNASVDPQGQYILGLRRGGGVLEVFSDGGAFNLGSAPDSLPGDPVTLFLFRTSEDEITFSFDYNPQDMTGADIFLADGGIARATSEIGTFAHSGLQGLATLFLGFDVSGGAGTVTIHGVNAMDNSVVVPAMSPWGMVLLSALILAATIGISLRRRAGAHSHIIPAWMTSKRVGPRT